MRNSKNSDLCEPMITIGWISPSRRDGTGITEDVRVCAECAASIGDLPESERRWYCDWDEFNASAWLWRHVGTPAEVSRWIREDFRGAQIMTDCDESQIAEDWVEANGPVERLTRHQTRRAVAQAIRDHLQYTQHVT